MALPPTGCDDDDDDDDDDDEIRPSVIPVASAPIKQNKCIWIFILEVFVFFCFYYDRCFDFMSTLFHHSVPQIY